MTLSIDQRRDSADEAIRGMYRRTLAHWAIDLLGSRPRAAWPGGDPLADFRDRDWRCFYTGDILDD